VAQSSSTSSHAVTRASFFLAGAFLRRADQVLDASVASLFVAVPQSLTAIAPAMMML